jgi:uncharacterized membrane protein YfcA
MGLLAIVMAPVEAAAILVLPSFVTNVWEMVAGPSLTRVVRRLWPMMVAACLGIWAGAEMITGATARYGTALLGAALVLYAVTGLASVRVSASREQEWWLGPIAGAVTGLITAAAGVFVIPAVPYLQAIGLEKEELVQALGLSFTVSTVALTINLAFAGAINASIAGQQSARWRWLVWGCGSGRRCDRGCSRQLSDAGYSSDCCCLACIWLDVS